MVSGGGGWRALLVKMIPESLVSLMWQFVLGEIDAPRFVLEYQTEWKKYRDAGYQGSMITDRAFTAADCYSPAPRMSLEITAEELKTEVADLLGQLGRPATN